MLLESWALSAEIIGNPVCLTQESITLPTGLPEETSRALHKS